MSVIVIDLAGDEDVITTKKVDEDAHNQKKKLRSTVNINRRSISFLSLQVKRNKS